MHTTALTAPNFMPGRQRVEGVRVVAHTQRGKRRFLHDIRIT